MKIKASAICWMNCINWTKQYADLFKKVGNSNRQKAERRRNGFEALLEAILNGELYTED